MNMERYVTDNATTEVMTSTILEDCPPLTWPLTALTDTLHLYCLPVLIVSGVVMNSVNFVVFRSSTLRLYAFGVYIPALAVLDSLALVSEMPRRWLNLLYQTVGWGTGVTPYDTTHVACKTLTLLSESSRLASVWTVVAMATERSSVALNPYRLSPIRQARTARYIVLAICVASILISSHVILAWESSDSRTTAASFTTLSTYENSSADANRILALFDYGRLFGHVTNAKSHTDNVPQCRPEADSVMILFTMIAADALLFPFPVFVLCVLTAVSIRGLMTSSRIERCRRLSVDLTSRLRAERHVVIMIVWISVVHIALALPRLVTWCVLLYFWMVADNGNASMSCAARIVDRDRAAAANDVAEMVFTASYAMKFLICIMAGRDVIGQI